MKPYPCCRHVHPAIDAALELRERLQGGAAPTRLHVESYPAALDVTDRPDPRTPHQARFSIQYAVARTLVHGRPGLDAFEHAALDDPDVRGLLPRVSVAVCSELADAYPARWGARLTAGTGEGEELQVTREQATGDPDLPLDDAGLGAKVRGLFAWAGLGGRETEELLAGCGGLTRNGPAPELPRGA